MNHARVLAVKAKSSHAKSDAGARGGAGGLSRSLSCSTSVVSCLSISCPPWVEACAQFGSGGWISAAALQWPPGPSGRKDPRLAIGPGAAKPTALSLNGQPQTQSSPRLQNQRDRCWPLDWRCGGRLASSIRITVTIKKD